MSQSKRSKAEVLGAKFRCMICGKITSGRRPRLRGDGTFYYPRRHPSAGDPSKPCPGNLHEAEWVKVDESGEVSS